MRQTAMGRLPQRRRGAERERKRNAPLAHEVRNELAPHEGVISERPFPAGVLTRCKLLHYYRVKSIKIFIFKIPTLQQTTRYAAQRSPLFSLRLSASAGGILPVRRR